MGKKNNGPRARNWVFTLNNYTTDDVHRLRDLIDDPRVKYLCWGYEIAPSTGTKHLQGFISFNQQLRHSPVIKLQLGHIEVAKGSPAQCKTYCEKEESKDPDADQKFEEFGDVPGGQGKRSDLDDMAQMVLGGKRMRDIAQEAPALFVKHGNGFERLRATTAPKRDWQPELVYLWGVTRSGKSIGCKELAFTKYPEDQVYFKPAGKWWGLYDGEECCIINDFCSSDMSLREWNRVFDHSNHLVEPKGKHTPLLFKDCYLSSNWPPIMLWPGVSEGRRISAIARITNCYFFWRDWKDPYCPQRIIHHDPFEIPPEAHDWIAYMEPEHPVIDYLEKGAQNHKRQCVE